jgi:hypothetical protein
MLRLSLHQRNTRAAIFDIMLMSLHVRDVALRQGIEPRSTQYPPRSSHLEQRRENAPPPGSKDESLAVCQAWHYEGGRMMT